MFNKCVNVHGLKREEGKRKGEGRMIYQNRVAQIPLLFPGFTSSGSTSQPFILLGGRKHRGCELSCLSPEPSARKISYSPTMPW